MLTLADIDGQSLSSVIDDFMICRVCSIVDRERSRIVANSPCPACHKPAGTARRYFGLNIGILIDLVQQSYHSATPTEEILGPQSSDVGVVLFFCTLREALLNNLFDYLFLAERLSDRIAKKLLDDNKVARQKFALFGVLVGKSWAEAVQEASSHEGVDFRSISKLMQDASDIRNRFLHEASGWGVARDFATECINSTFTLLHLFVSLHNLYVQPRLSEAAFPSDPADGGNCVTAS